MQRDLHDLLLANTRHIERLRDLMSPRDSSLLTCCTTGSDSLRPTSPSLQATSDQIEQLMHDMSRPVFPIGVGGELAEEMGDAEGGAIEMDAGDELGELPAFGKGMRGT